MFIDYFPTFLLLELINALRIHFFICYFGKLLPKKQKVIVSDTDWPTLSGVGS